MGIVLAQHFNVPFVPIRKAGKLPGECIAQEYGTEYSKDKVEIQKGSVDENSNVIIVDDLLATGGTLKVACDLVQLCGAKVSSCFVFFELVELKGRDKLDEPSKVISLYQK